MELTFECPECRMIDHVDGVESASEALCRHCRAIRPVHREAFDGRGKLRACPWCGSADLRIRKDFPRSLGLAIAGLGGAAGAFFWYHGKPVSAGLALLAATLTDAVLYARLPDATVCRRCSCQVRGPGARPEPGA